MNGPTTPPDPAKLFAESAERVTKFWTDFAGKCGGMPGMESPTPDAMRQMRNAFLNTLSASYDEYLRSPEFTGQLSQMLQQGVQVQQRMTEMMGQAKNAMQEPSRQDMDAIMEVMQRLERRIGDGYDRLDQRLKAMEAAISGQAKAGKPAASRTTAKSAPARKAARPAATRKTAKPRSKSKS
jgi:hypothetical protein